jgi:hypothetical protein
MSDDPFLSIAEELYGLTPGEFTDARNDYAKELRSDGDRELSERVKALRKPAVAAWVVNVLVRRDADEMTQVLELGESLRAAQADLDGDALRELTRQRRRLVSAVAGKGQSLARELGHKISESVVRQVEETLHAAMVDTDAAAAVRTGMLVDPLSATGVGSLKVATAVAEHTALGRSARPLADVAGPKGARKRSDLHAVPDEDPEEKAREQRKQARAEARRAVQGAEADLHAAQHELGKRDKRVAELQASALQVNGEIDELRRRIDELEDRLEHLDDEAEDAASERDEAAREVAAAESALEAARAQLEKLTD